MIVRRSVEGCPHRNASEIPPQVNEILNFEGVQNLMTNEIYDSSSENNAGFEIPKYTRRPVRGFRPGKTQTGLLSFRD